MQHYIPCSQNHPGPCDYVTTAEWDRFPLIGTPGRSRRDRSLEGGIRFDRGRLPLGRLPGVYLLGDYYVGSSRDIAQRLSWHTNMVTYQPGTALYRAYRDYLDRHQDCMPRVTILSLHELDEMYCINRLIEFGFRLINLDVRPQSTRTCIADESPARITYLRELLAEVNRLQVETTNCG